MVTKLKQERQTRNWSQLFVAKQLKISREAVQMIETGKCKPSYDVLVKLLDLFGYEDPRQLFAVVDDQPNLSKEL